MTAPKAATTRGGKRWCVRHSRIAEMRKRWNVDEELAAELQDTVEAERAKPRGRNGKRKKAKA